MWPWCQAPLRFLQDVMPDVDSSQPSQDPGPEGRGCFSSQFAGDASRYTQPGLIPSTLRWGQHHNKTKKGTNRVAKVPKTKYLYCLLWFSDMKQLFHIPTINSLYVGKKPRFNNLTHLGMLPTGIFEIQGNWPRSQQHLHRGFALRLVNWQKEKVRLSFSHHTWKNVYVIYIYKLYILYSKNVNM